MTRRSYAGGVQGVTLTSTLTDLGTTMMVSSVVGFPDGTNGPFAVTVGKGTPNEEKMLLASSGGGSMQIAQRGYDGTAPKSHDSGEEVRLVGTSIDFDEANKHVNQTAGAHGLTGTDAVVGEVKVQTLTNKTIDGDANVIRDIKLALQPEVVAALDAEKILRADGDALRYTKTESDAKYALTTAPVDAVAAHVAELDPHAQYLLEETTRGGLSPSQLPKAYSGERVWVGEWQDTAVGDTDPAKVLATVNLSFGGFPDDSRKLLRVVAQWKGITTAGQDSDVARWHVALRKASFEGGDGAEWVGYGGNDPEINGGQSGNLAIPRNGNQITALLKVPQGNTSGQVQVRLTKISGSCNPTISPGFVTVEQLVI